MNANPSKLLRLGAALSLLAALLAFAVRAVAAQTPAPAQGVPGRLSLGDAARLAASRTAAVQSAEFRVNEAQARVTQSRASLLPQVSAVPNWSSHTINSASFGFNFPAEPGKPPLLDPNGQIIGPKSIIMPGPIIPCIPSPIIPMLPGPIMPVPIWPIMPCPIPPPIMGICCWLCWASAAPVPRPIALINTTVRKRELGFII